MKHDPEVKNFYSDRHFYNSQETANIARDYELRRWNQILYFDKSLGYPTLEVKYSKILSGRIDFIS